MSQTDKKRAIWTLKMEKYFVRCLQKANDEGRGSDGNFKAAVMNDILKKFNSKMDVIFTLKQIRDKFDQV